MTAYRRLILPSILLLAALFLRQFMVDLYDQYGQLFDWLPFLAMGVSIVLSIFYNLCRTFVATLLVLVTYTVIQTELQVTLENFTALFSYTAICIVVPCVVLLLFFVPEKGLRNKYGLVTVATAIVLMITPVIISLVASRETLTEFIITHLSPRPFDVYVQSVYTTVLFAAAFIAGMIRLARVNEEFIAAILSFLVYVFITLSFFQVEKISTILFFAIAIILIASSLRSSYNLAYRDELTGLLGRRALNDRMKTLGKKYVVAMSDVDHFKKFNDTYGHDIGDDVLKIVASRLGSVEGGGIPYRYGGEEFCILFPGKTLDEAQPFLEAVRKSVENYKIVVRNLAQRPKSPEKALERRGRRKKNRDNKAVSVTISLGAAECNDMTAGPEDVLKAADSALYRAKQQGRNCVILSTA